MKKIAYTQPNVRTKVQRADSIHNSLLINVEGLEDTIAFVEEQSHLQGEKGCWTSHKQYEGFV